jgi:hypothetical protein
MTAEWAICLNGCGHFLFATCSLPFCPRGPNVHYPRGRGGINNRTGGWLSFSAGIFPWLGNLF